MLYSLLKAPFARRLVYLLCLLMVLGGQPLMALEQNIRIVPKDDTPDWLETWGDGATYRDAWDATTTWSRDVAREFQGSLDTWWDGSWTEAWRWLEASMAEATGPSRVNPLVASSGAASSSIVTAQLPIFAAAAAAQEQPQESDLSEEELKKLAETDSLARPDEAPAKTITKAEPMPNAEGLRVGSSSFRPPKELIQQLDGKADLDNIPLIPGLNLVSLPEEPTSSDPATVFNAIGGAYTKVWVHELCDTANPWKIFDPNDPASSDLTEIDHTNGFWIEASSPVELPSDGTLPASTTFELCPGWNLIGYPAAQPRHVTNALHTIEGKYIRVIGYDASDADDPWEFHSIGVPYWANDLQEMVPGRGYWVLATEAATLTIANEGPDPVVEITSPEDLGVVTDFTDVIGTVQSPILESWHLTFQLAGEGEPVELASGVTPVVGSELGVLDPTLLQNGLYELRLLATDHAGRQVEDAVDVTVEGELKIGHFRLEFLDLETLLDGIPLQVARVYDSRDKDLSGDFGYGWHMAVSQVRVQENGLAGKGWRGVVQPGIIPSYCIEPDRPHVVAVTLPDGELMRFLLEVTPSCQLGAPPQLAEYSFVPLPGTRASLRAVSPPSQLLVVGSFPGPLELWNSDITTVLDDEVYELTLESGVKLTIHDEDGLLKIEGERSDTIDYSSDLIQHSDGPAFNILRDGSGRVREIVGLLGERLTYGYDVRGDLVSFEDEVGDVIRFVYDQNHLLLKVIDPDGREVLAANYDDDSRLIGVCDGTGDGCWQTTHELTDRQEIIADPEGGVLTLTYDDRGNIVSVENALGNTWAFEFDDLDQMTRQIDPLGNVTEMHWDSAGNLTSIIEPHEESEPDADYTTTFRWGPGRQLEAFVTPGGGTLSMEYDASGNLLSLQDGEGQVLVAHTYDEQGRQTSESGPYGSISYSNFDSFGNPQEQVADGVTTTSSFDAAGRILSYSQDGRTASFGYDERGREVSADYGLGGPPLQLEYGITNDWTAASAEGSPRLERDIGLTGRISRIQVADGLEAQIEYDRAGRIHRISAPGSQDVTAEYDAAGRMTSITRPNGGTTTYVYDAADRPIEIRDPLGHVATLKYRPDGKIKAYTDALDRTWSFETSPLQATITDPLGRETTTELSPYGLPVRQVWADGSTFEIQYLHNHPMLDAEQRPTSIKDEGGRAKTFAYGDDMLVDEIRDSTDAAWSFAYTEDDLVENVTDPVGEVVAFTYDDRKRVETSTWGGSFVDEFDYDASGNLSRHVRSDGTELTLGWDELGRPVSRQASTGEIETFTWGVTGLASSTSSNGTIEYTNDPDGNLQRIDYPDGSSVVHERDLAGQLTAVHAYTEPTAPAVTTQYRYDEVGNLVELEDPLGGLTTFEYNAVNRLTRRVLPNGVESTVEYDLRDQISSIEHRQSNGTILASFVYERLPGGEPFKITLEDGSWIELDYDMAPRLVDERYYEADGTLLETRSYSYDSAGNRSTRTVDGTTETYSYHSGHRLASVNDGSESRDLEYDGAGRMVLSRQGSFERAYSYDYRDRLTEVREDGTVLASFGYDADDRRISNSDGTFDRRLISAPAGDQGLELPLVVTSDTGDQLGAFVYVGSTPLMRIVDGTPVYYLSDALGSISALADTDGQSVARFHYDGFGEVRSATGAQRDAPAELGGDFRFHGAWLDADTALYHMQARYYAPELGRFVSRDPMGLVVMSPELSHPYVFANSNPFLYEDPTGLFASVASFNVASAVQSTLNGIRGGFMRRLLRRLLREAKEIAIDLIKDLIIRSFLERIGIGKYLSGVTDLATKLEHGVQETVCNILGPNRIPSFVWLEPKIAEDGRPFSDGFHCPPTDQKRRQALKWKGLPSPGPRPDFLLSSKQPTRMKGPRPFQSMLPGDVKVSVHHAYKTWTGDQVGQKEALRNHANLYAIRNVLLITARGGSKTTCKKVEALFQGDLPPSLINIWSLVGVFSKRKSGC